MMYSWPLKGRTCSNPSRNSSSHPLFCCKISGGTSCQYLWNIQTFFTSDDEISKEKHLNCVSLWAFLICPALHSPAAIWPYETPHDLNTFMLLESCHQLGLLALGASGVLSCDLQAIVAASPAADAELGGQDHHFIQRDENVLWQQVRPMSALSEARCQVPHLPTA